jgi:mannose/cellobiose epimerase-like protein (N-acyl-D-glucosamine 2-epimerase family)
MDGVTVSRLEESWLAAETARLLRFAEGARDPAGGYGRQLLRGGLIGADSGGSCELWVTGRMTHVFALGELLGHPGAGGLVEHGLAGLRGRLRDGEHGGWFAAVDGSGHPVDDRKPFYQHCFVLLGAASALVAGHDDARVLLDEALEVTDRWFWDEAAGMPRESWDRGWTQTEAYRGVNATMHGVEAFLAVYDATGDTVWRDRALRMTERVVHGFARAGVRGDGVRGGAGTAWRIPEHFDPDWNPLPEHNRDHPADPFRPYGATVGHALEWSRLCLHLRAAIGDGVDGPGVDGPGVDGASAPPWLLADACSLFDVAVSDGWSADGGTGFVYTVDWDGKPVVHERMSWVAAEAVAAATVLHRVTRDSRYAEQQHAWWAWIRAHLVDERGAWHPELGRDNQPSATVWTDQPEVYHAVQATLFPRIPVRPSVAKAVADARTLNTCSDPD